jgi:flagellin-like protein
MVFDTSQQKDGAVSPVIGVVLMVAITVILAAIIGTFVLGLGQETNAGANAGVSFDYDGSEVTATVTSAPRADSVAINLEGSEQASWDTDIVGSTTSFSANEGQQVSVVATYQGESQVVQQYTVG